MVWAAANTVAALKVAYKIEWDAAIRTRLHALWLLWGGWRLEPVAEVVGVDHRTVQRWVA